MEMEDYYGIVVVMEIIALMGIYVLILTHLLHNVVLQQILGGRNGHLIPAIQMRKLVMMVLSWNVKNTIPL